MENTGSSEVWLSAPCLEGLDCLGNPALDCIITLDDVGRFGRSCDCAGHGGG